MISYYRSKRIDPQQTPVVDVLERLGSPFSSSARQACLAAFCTDHAVPSREPHGLGPICARGATAPLGFPPVLELLQRL